MTGREADRPEDGADVGGCEGAGGGGDFMTVMAVIGRHGRWIRTKSDNVVVDVY